DAATTAALSFNPPSSPALAGIVSADQVSVDTSTYTASFAAKDVAAGIAVTVSALGLTGAQSADYTLIQPGGLSADISTRLLSITANDVVMSHADGTTLTAFTSAGLQ